MKKSLNEFLSNTWLPILILTFLFVWYLFSQMGKKDLIIVSEDTHKIEKVKKDDPRVTKIWEFGQSFVLNNSNSLLILKPIFYGKTHFDIPKSILISPSKNIKPVEPESIYVFKKPLKKIKTVTGTNITRWYLQRNKFSH
jgi:hypothetical protein